MFLHGKFLGVGQARQRTCVRRVALAALVLSVTWTMNGAPEVSSAPASGHVAAATPVAPQPRSERTMAETVARQIKGAKVVAVSPNGSMQALFKENAFLVVEPSRRETVRAGDIVTYEHQRLGTTVVQRIATSRDLEGIATGTPLMRVVVIIYARHGGSGNVAKSGVNGGGSLRAAQPAAATNLR